MLFGISAHGAELATLVLVTAASGLVAAELWSIRFEFRAGRGLDPGLLSRDGRHAWRARRSSVIPELALAQTVLLAGSLAAWELPGIVRAVAAAGSLVTAALLYTTLRYGRDGSDDMLLIVVFMLSVALVVRQDWAVQAALVGIAGLAMIAYAASGAGKLAGSSWRDGTAMAVVLRSETYGSPLAGRLASEHRTLTRLAGYAVIAVELLVPVAVVLGGWPLVGALALAAGFHVGVGAVMGLNRFTPAFIATYPALIWLADELAVGG